LGEDTPPPIDAPDAFGVFAISSVARLALDGLVNSWWSQLLELKKASDRVAAAKRIELP